MTLDAPSRNDNVTIRTCPVCQGSFEPTGRREYCSDACRQAAWRARHLPAAPQALVPPRGHKRAITVYLCAGCDTRLLGEQYCPDCHTFMRALGAGGLCPCCDEPIAVAELIQQEDNITTQ